MMKKLLIFLLLLAPLASAIDPLADTSQMQFKVSSDINVIKEGLTNYIQYVQADLYLYPKPDYRQELSDLETDSSEIDNYLRFYWEDPEQDKLILSSQTTVTSSRGFREVKTSVPFPIKALPEDVLQYTEPTENIDSNNNDVIKLASSLAAGEDDLFIVVHKLASWVEENIEYNLNTLTADVAQKSSWVLEERFGVCDELTSLFIAMARSLGIPAKYVSGVAYTNYQGKDDWGPHAWAEVYFPGYGWVPFDITYKQFSYIDSTHIKLKESYDSSEASVKYEWSGKNINLEAEPLEFDISLDKELGIARPFVDLKIYPIEKEIDFGSFNIVTATVENNWDFYVPAYVTLLNTQDISIIGDNARRTLLKPYETKKVYWLINVSEDLESKYRYTFPLVAITDGNLTAESSFISTNKDDFFSYSEMSSLLSTLEEEEEKKYSKQVDISCSSEKQRVYLYEKPSLECSVKNIGNILLEGLSLCLEEDCKNFDLGITQEKRVLFNITDEIKTVKVTASAQDLTKTVFPEMEILDKPLVEISNLSYPEQVVFDEPFSITFNMEKASRSVPKDVKVNLENIVQELKRGDLEEQTDVTLNLNSAELEKSVNELKLEVSYYDENSKKYTTTKDIQVDLKVEGILNNILYFFSKFL